MKAYDLPKPYILQPAGGDSLLALSLVCNCGPVHVCRKFLLGIRRPGHVVAYFEMFYASKLTSARPH